MLESAHGRDECEWFEINVHGTQALSPEAALKLVEDSPGTCLDNSDTDKHGVVAGSVAHGSEITM